VPTPDDTLEVGDELVFVCTAEMEEQVHAVVLGRAAARPQPARPEPARPGPRAAGVSGADERSGAG
jgi:hypothetical protein